MTSSATLGGEEPTPDSVANPGEPEDGAALCERAIELAYSGEPRQGLTLAFKARR